MTWKACRLGDVVTLKRGYDLPDAKRVPGEVPIVSSSGVTGYHNVKKVLGPGVVTGRYGTLGQVYYIEQDYWPLNTSLYVCDFKGNDPAFIAYFLTHVLRGTQSDKAAVPGVNRNDLHDRPVRAPRVDVQRRIVEVLRPYDEFISNNARRLALLDEFVRSLFREWFIVLRFPGHEHVPVRSGVPQGWDLTTLGACCGSLEDGDWIESKDQGGYDYRLLQISNIGVNEFVETGNLRFITEDTFRRLKCREVKPGQILISRMPKPIGRAWLVTKMPWKMVTAVDVAILTPKQGVTDEYFLVHHLNSPATIEHCERRAVGATRPRVARRALATVPVLVPPPTLQALFREVAEPVHAQRANLFRQNEKLRTARDLLLPRLMSGEITV